MTPSSKLEEKKESWKCVLGIHDWARWNQGEYKYHSRVGFMRPIDLHATGYQSYQWRDCLICGRRQEEDL